MIFTSIRITIEESGRCIPLEENREFKIKEYLNKLVDGMEEILNLARLISVVEECLEFKI